MSDAGEPRPQSPVRLVSALLVVVVTCLTGCASGNDSVESGEPSVFDALPEPKKEERRKSPAVTQIGREILPRTGLVVRGHTVRVSQARGVELGRFEVEEVLRSVPWDQLPDSMGKPVLTVLCGEPGMIPRPGQEAILLVARRVRSSNHDIVQVVPIGGTGGAERLAAYRTYLEIESLPLEDERVDALLAYLRVAVKDPRRWTRNNAALEFGSLARARPDDLGADVVDVLRSATRRGNRGVVQLSLQSALARAERNVGRAPRVPEPVLVERPDLSPFTVRFDASVDAAERRLIVMEAALELESAAVPLLRRALDDGDARVREAAAAAAGQLRIAGMGEALVPLLTRGEPLPVRRSAVRALGHLRYAAAVPSLAVLASADSIVGEDACYALARVRNSEAIVAIGKLLSTSDGERRELLEFLLSDAFADQERALGRPID